jgi:uncharacterized protein (TIGR03663 family)
MATVDEVAPSLDRVQALLARFGLDRVHVAVFEIVVVALVARLYDLGGRVAHWDEARVAYWTLDFIETGAFEYRPIIHGPFYHHVNKLLFGVVGASDASMRLVVAVAGGLFPLVALLFRDRLRDLEVVALAFFLAFNPVLLYYSRFMRGDPLVAMFMFTAFALFVRAFDTRRVGYLHAGVVFTALGFTVKENALLYLVCWAGAGALVVDHRFLRRDGRGWEWPGALYDGVGRAWRLLRRRWLTPVVAAVEFLVVVVYFYAPRVGPGSESGVGLWRVLDDPTVAPAVGYAATVGSWQDFWGLWIRGGHQDHSYIPYMGDFLLTMAYGALALSLLALVGFLADRYTGDGPSTLVSACFYWGFASVLGYPLVTDIMAPWAVVNAVVPLAVPAAVGLALVVRWGHRAVSRRDLVAAGITGFALVVVVGQIAATGAVGTYLSPQSESNELVQYAQPAGDIDPVMDLLAETAPGHEGTDVLLYGEYLVDGDEGPVPREPACAKWFNSLPLPWYFSKADADVTCAENAAGAGTVVSESQPVLVVVKADQDTDVRPSLQDYVQRTHRLRAWGTRTHFYVHQRYADRLPPAEE